MSLLVRLCRTRHSYGPSHGDFLFPLLGLVAVSFYGSFFELCVTVLLVPMSAIPGLGHVPLAELPGYLGRGIQCWAGVAAPGNACIGDPYATLVYHAFNLSWNIAMIILLKLVTHYRPAHRVVLHTFA